MPEEYSFGVGGEPVSSGEPSGGPESTEEVVVGSSAGSNFGTFLGNTWANIKNNWLLYTLLLGSMGVGIGGAVSNGGGTNETAVAATMDSVVTTVANIDQNVSSLVNTANETHREVAATKKTVQKIDTITTNTWNRVDCALKCPSGGTASGNRGGNRGGVHRTPRDTLKRPDTVYVHVKPDTVYINLPCPDSIPTPKTKAKKAKVECEYYFPDGRKPDFVVIDGKIVYERANQR